MEQAGRDDSMLVITAEDSGVRCLVASTRHLVSTAAAMHGTSPVATAALGRALTAAALMTHMLGPDETLTLQWDGGGPIGRIIVTAVADNSVRGYVTNPAVDIPVTAGGNLDVGGAVGRHGFLYVIKGVGEGQPYTGSIALPSGEIAEDLAAYFAQSEQTPSVVGLGVLIEVDRTVAAAGGFIIQTMPGVTEETIAALEQNVRAIPKMTEMLSVPLATAQIADRLLSGLRHHTLAELALSYRCSCSKERIEQVLTVLSDDDLRHLAASREPTQVSCDFCRLVYEFDRTQLVAIMEARGVSGA